MKESDFKNGDCFVLTDGAGSMVLPIRPPDDGDDANLIRLLGCLTRRERRVWELLLCAEGGFTGLRAAESELRLTRDELRGLVVSAVGKMTRLAAADPELDRTFRPYMASVVASVLAAMTRSGEDCRRN